MRNIIVVGERGCAKRSLINMLDGKEVAKTSNKSLRCPFQFKDYVDNKGNRFLDTVSLNESDKGKVPEKDAMKALMKLLKSLELGVGLIIFVVQKGYITETMIKNFRVFAKGVCQGKVPVILVISGCESYMEDDKLLMDNKAYFEEKGMWFDEIVNGCFATELEKGMPTMRVLESYEETKSQMMDILNNENYKSTHFGPAHDWLKNVMKMTWVWNPIAEYYFGCKEFSFVGFDDTEITVVNIRKNKKTVTAFGNWIYSKEDVETLREVIFRQGVVLDTIMESLNLKDNKILQLVNREYNQAVIWNNKSWRKRRIVITKRNAHEIAKRFPMRVWVSAKVDFLFKNDYEDLWFVWIELEDLFVINPGHAETPTDIFSACLLRDVLPCAVNLRRLVVSANLLCGTEHKDLRNLEDLLWSKLKHFEIVFHMNDMERKSYYRSFVHGNTETSKAYFELMGSFDWKLLETFKLCTADDITLSILTNNFLKNVRNLELNTVSGASNVEPRLWSIMRNIQTPKLTHLTVKLFPFSPKVIRDFRFFLDNQARLTSLHLHVNFLKAGLFQVDEDYLCKIPLKHLNVQFEFTDCIRAREPEPEQDSQSSPIPLLSKFTQLETLTFKGESHLSWPPKPSAEDLIDSIPQSVTSLMFRLCSKHTRYDGRGQTRNLSRNKLQKRMRLKLPNLKNCKIEVPEDCHVCVITDFQGMQQTYMKVARYLRVVMFVALLLLIIYAILAVEDGNKN